MGYIDLRYCLKEYFLREIFFEYEDVMFENIKI